MKVSKKKIVKIIREMLDEDSGVNVTKTEQGLVVIDDPGSDARAVFNQKQVLELIEKLTAALD